MHGSKRWVRVPRDFDGGRWGVFRLRSEFPRIPYIKGGRFKRSRHKTLGDRLLVRERDLAWEAPASFVPSGAPSWYRRIRRRRYRAQMRNLVRRGNFDLLHPPLRDASWYW